jgi:hypothetical protein
MPDTQMFEVIFLLFFIIFYRTTVLYLFLDQKRKMKLVNRIKKNIAKFEFKSEDVGLHNSLNINN